MTDRRTALKAGVAAALAAGVPDSVPARGKTAVRSGPLRIGLILGGGNHMQNMWARLINCVPGANGIPYTPRRTGMVISHVWSVLPEWAAAFSKQFGVEKAVKRFDGMIGKVDGLVIDAFFGTPYNHRLAEPYLRAGVPVFVNRPFSDSVGKAKGMVALAGKYKTPIMTGSSFEHLEFAMSVRNRFPKNKVAGYEAWNSSSDFYSHGIHGLWLAYACFGGGIETVSHRTESWIRGGGTTTVGYSDRGDGPFTGAIFDWSTENYLCAVRVKGHNQMYGFGPADWDQYMWIHMLQRMQVMFEHRDMPDTPEQIVEKTAMFVAAFRSLTREGGNPVSLKELDDDWAIGPPWGHSGNPSMEEQKGYAALFGEERGELRPDRTMG
jgi:hypothetical protein